MKETIYKVRLYKDCVYEVYNEYTFESYFQGSLADCEAYIRLHEQGYM